MSTDVDAAWRVIIDEKHRELAELRETRKVVEEILDKLKPWQAKCIADGLFDRYRDQWGHPRSPKAGSVP